MIRLASLITSLRDRTLRGDAAERGVAMLSAIFFMVVVAGLSVVLLSVALSQQAPTLTAQKGTKTIYSAQAGLQAALGVIRTAAGPASPDGQRLGSTAKLPCALNGTVEGTGTGTSYQVEVQYFIIDPRGKDASWRDDEKMDCSPPDGVLPDGTSPKKNASGVWENPQFAYIRATGIGEALPGKPADFGNRSLSAIYKFRVNSENIAGGRILSRDGQYCLYAESENDGSEMAWRPIASCTDNAKELWVYATDYRLKLARTILNNAAGQCITGPVNDGEDTQRAKLQPCSPINEATRWNQLWSWTGSYSWQGQRKEIADGPSSYCLSPGGADNSNLSAKRLEVRKGGCSGTFLPSAQVGPGAAGVTTKQIVNFKEFGRCADVTDENIDKSFMISYPCKQDPTGTGVNLKWNHKWYYSEPVAGQASAPNQNIVVKVNNNENDKRCFTSKAAGGDTTFRVCDGSNGQKWTRVYNSGDYDTSYLFKDYWGRCLVADSSAKYNNWSKVRTAACNGSLEQKWNAPPIFVESDFGGYREVSE